MSSGKWDAYWKTLGKDDYWYQPAPAVHDLVGERDPKQQSQILDLGCGVGRHALAFASRGFQVTAVDSSQQAIDKLRLAGDKLELGLTTIIGDCRDKHFLPQPLLTLY